MKSVHYLWRGFACLLLGVSFRIAEAQPTPISLDEAVSYALQNNLNIKSTQLDALSAEARIGEIRAVGLPQVTGQLGLNNNLIIQRVFLPAQFADPSAPPDAPPIAAQFGVTYAGNAGVTLSQLIFNGSYFVGLKAAATYRELAQKNLAKSKVDVAEAVTKAYYSVQVAEQRAGVLDLNITRLDSLLRETRILNETGFVERIDVNRLEVQLNNLRTEKQKVQNLIELSYSLLKYQMGMPLDQSIRLKDSLADIDLEQLRTSTLGTVDYAKRIEYSLLTTQGKLAELDIRNIRSGYLPTVAGVLTYGHNNGRNDFGDLFSSRWFNNSLLGINIQIPIFDGFQKKYQLQQAKITLDKVGIGRKILEQSIDLQARQATITIQNAFETLETEKRNLALAEEVVRVSRIKYKEGVGSNIEVISAESSLKEAQTNYFAALYDLMIAKVDLSKARGELYPVE